MNIEALLDYQETETDIYLPNEIFADLQDNIKSPKHVAFAYSYYYAVNYLYRYSKYNIKRYTQSDLKELLGYNKDNKRIDYIIKRSGILDLMGYTRTLHDYPIENWMDVDNRPEFKMYSEYKAEFADELKQVGLYNDRNYSIKYPVKAFYRTLDAEQDEVMDGTFFDRTNTHRIPVSRFITAMSLKEVGTIGFYLYGYLKHKIDYYKGRLTQGLESIAKTTGLSKATVVKYRDALEKYGFIIVTHEQYVFNNTDNCRANTYTTPER